MLLPIFVCRTHSTKLFSTKSKLFLPVEDLKADISPDGSMKVMWSKPGDEAVEIEVIMT